MPGSARLPRLYRRTLLLGAVAAAVGLVATTAGCTYSKPVLAAVRIGPAPVEFRVDVAQTAEQQRDGLSGRDELSAGTGMLFRFGSRSESVNPRWPRADGESWPRLDDCG